MIKRTTSIALVFLMVLSMLVTAMPVWAAPVGSNDAEYSVGANITSVVPGDEIEFTVYLQQTGNLNAFSANLSIPAGLTYVADSGALVEDIKTTLGFDGMDWTPDPYMMVSGYGAESYTGTEKLALMTFKCTVDSGASAGDYVVTLDECLAGDDTYTSKDTVTCIPVTITVTAAPKPATGITLDQEELTLTVGDTETLVATVTPADTTDTVAWSSNKPAVATVDSNGMVTAVAPGEAIITAKAGEETATCTVKVSCAHNLQTVPAKESNCTEKGWDEYQKCTLCGALFDTSGGSRSDIPYRPLNDDHDFNMSEWGYQGDDGHAHVCTHNSAHHDTVVTHSFGDDDTCDICGYERTHVCANHLTKVEEKLADCTNPGNIEHYKCSCGKLYEDATAARELTEEDVNRGALGHDWIDATCTEAKTCDRCGETEGTALGHDWEGEWSSNADNHWHACTRCDAKDGEAAHNPGAPATETTPQTCTDCGYVIASATGHVCANHLSYVPPVDPDCTNPGNIEHYKCTCNKLYADGTANVPLTEEEVKREPLGHNWADEWSSDETNHWHACTRCPEKDALIAHTPDRPEATETDPIKCTQCGYVIAPAIEHLCIDHLTEVPEVPATCITPGTKAHFKCGVPTCGKLYWDNDAHDEIDDPEELVISVIEHNWASEWSSDETNHWHACQTLGCDAKTDVSAHSPDHPDGATFEYPVLCVECGYVMEEQLEEGDIRIELPFTLTVKKTGDLDPNAQTFSFVAEKFSASVDYTIVQSILDTNGVGVYNGSFVFTIRESDKDNLREGFVFRQVRGSAAGWTYDETKFYVVPVYSVDGDTVEFWNFYLLGEDGMPMEENRPNGVSFTNSYYAEKTVEPSVPAEPSAPSAPAATAVPTNSNVPQTGDDSNLAFWIVLLLAGGCGAVIAGFRKKGNSDEE